jgi:hypothetical protein
MGAAIYASPIVANDVLYLSSKSALSMRSPLAA